jgi:hypothetical protein
MALAAWFCSIGLTSQPVGYRISSIWIAQEQLFGPLNSQKILDPIASSALPWKGMKSEPTRGVDTCFGWTRIPEA